MGNHWSSILSIYTDLITLHQHKMAVYIEFVVFQTDKFNTHIGKLRHERVLKRLRDDFALIFITVTSEAHVAYNHQQHAIELRSRRHD